MYYDLLVFFSPLGIESLFKNFPDFEQNKRRILDKSEFIDANFLTTSPKVLGFLSKKTKNYFIPNPSDPSFETLNNYKNNCTNDVFFAKVLTYSIAY